MEYGRLQITGSSNSSTETHISGAFKPGIPKSKRAVQARRLHDTKTFNFLSLYARITIISRGKGELKCV
ncbi:MAG: hypothetical protein PHE79_00995 [Eubacteriales bacterium]|nr:hypothetical protein [Eubacteriales bacterium]